MIGGTVDGNEEVLFAGQGPLHGSDEPCGFQFHGPHLVDHHELRFLHSALDGRRADLLQIAQAEAVLAELRAVAMMPVGQEPLPTRGHIPEEESHAKAAFADLLGDHAARS